MPDNYILRMENVYKKYGAVNVLNNIKLQVREGEFCTLVGPSGCGKSTFLRLLLGREEPTSGNATIDNEIIGYPDTTRGVVFQRYSLFPNLTALENVMLGKKLRHGYIKGWLKHKEIREEALNFLHEVGLADDFDKYPHELSGGMQQRISIVQSLVVNPKILLMDEPFGALDPGSRERLQLFVQKLWEKYKTTVFFVTHDLEEAVFLGTRILALSQYYRDGDKTGMDNGAKIVIDLPLNIYKTAKEKNSKEVGDLIQMIRKEAFDKSYLQEERQFSLLHHDSII